MKFVEGQRLFLGDPAVDDSVANFTKILIRSVCECISSCLLESDVMVYCRGII